MPESVYIGVGANMGDVHRSLKEVVVELGSISAANILVSSIWHSEPVGMAAGTADFGNGVIKIQCELQPYELLSHLQKIEVTYGRPANHKRLQSRMLDLDIIAFGDRIIVSNDLRIPHAHAWERLFVLMPLREIQPDFRFPDRPESLDELIRQAPQIEISV